MAAIIFIQKNSLCHGDQVWLCKKGKINDKITDTIIRTMIDPLSILQAESDHTLLEKGKIKKNQISCEERFILFGLRQHVLIIGFWVFFIHFFKTCYERPRVLQKSGRKSRPTGAEGKSTFTHPLLFLPYG